MFRFASLLMLLLSALACRSDPPHEIIARFEDARDLKVGDEVRIAGIRVGEVSGITVSADGRRADAVIRMDEEYADRVMDDPHTVAIVRREGTLLRRRYIEIRNQGTNIAESGAVIRGVSSEAAAIIAAAAGTIDATTAEAEVLLTETRERLKTISAKVDGAARDRVTSMLRQLDEVTSAGLSGAEALVADLAAGSQALAESLEALPREKIADHLNEGLTELDRAARSLSKMSRSIIVEVVRGRGHDGADDDATTDTLTLTPAGS